MKFNIDELAKSRHEDHRWLDKKFDIQGVVFLAGSRQYIEYVESLQKTYNEGDRAFYDAINIHQGGTVWVLLQILKVPRRFWQQSISA